MSVNLLYHEGGEKTIHCVAVGSEKDNFIYIYQTTWDLVNYFYFKNDREKQSSKQNCPRADGMSPVQHAPCPSVDSSSISSQVCYICSKVPRTRQTDSSSIALLVLLELVAGNQLAVRIYKWYVTMWTNTPKQLSAPCRASPRVLSLQGWKRFKQGVRDNNK